MFFRRKNNRVNCYRIIYDKETQRTHQKMLLSFGWLDDEMPQDLSILTDEEQQQLADFWQQKRKTIADEQRDKALQCATPRVLAMADALQHKKIDADEAARLWLATDKLRKELKKQGYRKPDKQPPMRDVFTLIDCD